MKRRIACLWVGYLLIAQGPILSQPHPTVEGHTLEHRIVRISTNFLVPENLPIALDVLTRAEQSCFNAILLSDVKFGFLGSMSPDYFQNLRTFLDSAASLGMRVIPETAYFGYSQPILFHNPNLAESLPVVDAPFVVEDVGGNLALNTPTNDIFPLFNGGFEEVPQTSHEFPHWDFQDDPGSVTFWDTVVYRSGNASCLISDPAGNGRIEQDVDVTPFRDYHISFWVKTENMSSGYPNVYIFNPDNNRELNFNYFEVETTQDWTEYNLTFNTLDATHIYLYFGVWDAGSGKMWIDDIQIRPTQFNNIVRRNTAPVTIKEMNGALLAEGVDVDSILDPLMGVDPYNGAYSIWHQQPSIQLPSGSSLQPGDTILVSYYHVGIVQDGQVCASLTEPEVIQISEQQMMDIKAEVEMSGLFEGWMFTHDEIRVHGWDQSPSFGTPGDDLAWNFQQLFQKAKTIDSTAWITVWSDMFDPHHNAYLDTTYPYYLVNGSWSDSWEGLPSEVSILNWNYADAPQASVQFFANRGHRQILAGYYDESTYYTPNWLQLNQGVSGIEGVMFTTWIDDYQQLEDWAEAIFDGCNFATSVTSPIPGDEIELIPNPTTGLLRIRGAEEINLQRLLGRDSSGRIVFEQMGSHPIVDLSGLPDGFYTVQLIGSQGIYHQMVVLSK